MQTTVILIRHGETMANREKQYTGALDMPLTPEGAAFIAEKAASGAYPPADRTYVSPMIRCRMTKDIIYPNVTDEIVIDDLRECHFGDFEGHNYEQLKDDPAFVKWLATNGLEQIPGGDSIEDFCSRTSRAFTETLTCAFGDGIKNVAYCVHGGVIMSIMGYINRLAPSWHFDFRMDNGCGYVLTVDSEDFLTTLKPITIDTL